VARFISHARSAQELRSEVMSDIQRRLDGLDAQLKRIGKPSAAEATRIARARFEFLEMLEYWRDLAIEDGTKP
jgi:hypothetical protein